MTTPAEPFEIKAGDHEPSIQTTLTLPGAAVPFTLTGATIKVYFIMRAQGEDGLPIAGPPKVVGLAQIVDADACIVRYDWQSTDTDTAGLYVGEWEVHRNGRRRTFPTRSYNNIVIWQDLGSAPAA